MMESFLYKNMEVFANTVQEFYMIHDTCIFGIHTIMVRKMHISILKLQKRYQKMGTCILKFIILVCSCWHHCNFGLLQ